MRATAKENGRGVGRYVIANQLQLDYALSVRRKRTLMGLEPATSLRGFVFNGATVRLRLWCANGLACQRLIQRRLHVVRRTRDIGRVWGGFAVNCAAVNDYPFRIDDHHVRRVLRAVSAACVAFGIQQQRGLMRLPRCRDLLRFFGRHISLCPGRIGIDCQPDNALISEFFLQVLHVAAAVMLFHERALWIKPFKDDVLTLILRQRMRLAFRVRERKIRRGASNRRRIGGKDCSSDQ